MNQRQITGRSSGSADVPIVLVTQRSIGPIGPDRAACSENISKASSFDNAVNRARVDGCRLSLSKSILF
jgi:hypothetical protein